MRELGGISLNIEESQAHTHRRNC